MTTYKNSNGTTYTLVTVPANFSAAETFCLGRGSHLVSYTSAEEQRAVEGYFTSQGKRQAVGVAGGAYDCMTLRSFSGQLNGWLLTARMSNKAAHMSSSCVADTSQWL